MQSSASAIPVASESFSAGSNSNDLTMDDNGVYGSEPLEQLAAGIQQFVRIERKGILEKTMQALGAQAGTVFSVVDCGADGVKVSIKLDLSSMTSAQGERINYSVVEGGTFLNPAAAEGSAILKAFNHLESKHRIRIVDFSSRVVQKLESYNTHDLVLEGIGSLENVLVQWDLLLGKFKEFTLKLEQEAFCDNVTGQRSARGQVYGVLMDYLICIQTNLREKTKDVRSELAEIEFDRQQYEEKLAERKQLLQNIQGPFREVLLPSKDLLDCVFSFYGLDDPQYINGPRPHSVVKSTVNFEFPYMPNFKYGGKLAISGKAYTSAESDEEAAYQALLFIENNFNTKVVDYNYSKRKKAVKEQNKLMLMLSTTLELADTVKMMFGELINAMQAKRRQFSFDPSSFFAGPMAAGQIDAYHFCANGLEDLDKYSANCYAACEPQFEVLQKLSWKLTVTKTDRPL